MSGTNKAVMGVEYGFHKKTVWMQVENIEQCVERMKAKNPEMAAQEIHMLNIDLMSARNAMMHMQGALENSFLEREAVKKELQEEKNKGIDLLEKLDKAEEGLGKIEVRVKKMEVLDGELKAARDIIKSQDDRIAFLMKEVSRLSSRKSKK